MQYYKIVSYIRAVGDPEDYTYYKNISDANSEIRHLEAMDPWGECKYEIESVDPDEEPESWPDEHDIYEPPESEEKVISDYNPNDPSNW